MAAVKAQVDCLLGKLHQVGPGNKMMDKRQVWAINEDQRMSRERGAQWLRRVEGVRPHHKEGIFQDRLNHQSPSSQPPSSTHTCSSSLCQTTHSSSSTTIVNISSINKLIIFYYYICCIYIFLQPHPQITILSCYHYNLYVLQIFHPLLGSIIRILFLTKP